MAQDARSKTGIVILVLVALGAVGGLYYLGSKPTLQPTAKAPPPAPGPVVAAPAPATPEFDVVRVDSSGNTVVAGRAEPGAEITLKSGDNIIGTATADAHGAFALVLQNPLVPGAQELSLSEKLPNGQVIAGSGSASVDVANGPNGQTLTVLSGPAGSKVVSGQGPQTGTLGIGTVDYDAEGHAIFSGTAPAGDQVKLSLDGKSLGTAVAGADGTWHLSAMVPAANGQLSLSDGTGSPVTAPFALETLANAVANGHIVIAPGDNLWVIARHVYGHGNLYTLIYKANAQQIRDPNLIYPGQAFALAQPKG
ncbi:MAG: Ig-like domain-containing protein [Acidocella sp.]|nr:Ig-like domain-containing protein [Acidocella sp.]